MLVMDGDAQESQSPRIESSDLTRLQDRIGKSPSISSHADWTTMSTVQLAFR